MYTWKYLYISLRTLPLGRYKNMFISSTWQQGPVLRHLQLEDHEGRGGRHYLAGGVPRHPSQQGRKVTGETKPGAVESRGWSVKCGVWSVECGVWNTKCGIWNVECWTWLLESEVWSMGLYLRASLLTPSSISSLEAALYTVQCTLYTLHSTLYTVHSTLYTRAPENLKLAGN